MKIFITGSTGLLGSALFFEAPKSLTLYGSVHHNMIVPNVSAHFYHMDITKRTVVDKVITKIKPDILIHTAAIATPDYCDKNQIEAKRVNVTGTKNLIDACKKNEIKFIYITTNGIYDGKKAPYDEVAEPKPIDCYGNTKLKAENIVRMSGLKFQIVRLITMYGWNNPHERQNPVTWQLKILGENKNPLNMVTDMFNNFLYNREAAKAIWKIAQLEEWDQTFNIAGAECISRYDLSVQIAKTFSMNEKMIYPVTLNFFKNYVPRPKNTCFVTTKMEKVLKQKPVTVKKGLTHMKHHPLSNESWKHFS